MSKKNKDTEPIQSKLANSRQNPQLPVDFLLAVTKLNNGELAVIVDPEMSNEDFILLLDILNGYLEDYYSPKEPSSSGSFRLPC